MELRFVTAEEFCRPTCELVRSASLRSFVNSREEVARLVAAAEVALLKLHHEYAAGLVEAHESADYGWTEAEVLEGRLEALRDALS